MNALTRARIAGLTAVAMLLTAVGSVAGYSGEVAATATVAVRGTVTCDAPFTLTATFIDAAGAPVAGLSVDWSFVSSPSSADKINKTPTITNNNGVATTTVSLAAVNGTRKIRATSGEVSASVVVTQACGGLPRTSTLPAGAPPVSTVLLLVLAGMMGGALALRRQA